MKPVRNDRIVVVLGPGSPELEEILRALGLAPLDDDSAGATLWLPARLAGRRSAKPVVAPAVAKQGHSLPLLLSIAQAASVLGVGRSTLYEMIGRGEVEVVHLGRAVRVPGAAVEELVEALPSRRATAV
jgi:excisionase family DNA binding protein